MRNEVIWRAELFGKKMGKNNFLKKFHFFSFFKNFRQNFGVASAQGLQFNDLVMLQILRLHDSYPSPSAKQRVFLDLLKKARDNEPFGP